MQLHSLPKHKKRVQRIGRGGKRGTTAGRGTKGQKSRAGRRRRPAERDLILRLPKQRGFRNKPKSDAAKVFNLGTLSEKLKSYAKAGAPLEISVELLKTAGLVGKNFNGAVKILAGGKESAANFPFTVKGIAVSKGVGEKMGK